MAEVVGVALIVLPIAVLFVAVTVLMWREYGREGPAFFWGIQATLWVPVWLGLWVLHG